MSRFQGPGRSQVYAQNGICATSHPLAAKVAVNMLEEGGNAVDAALAGAVLLGLCEPQMTGLGGDMFAIVKPAGSEDLVGLNASGRAPAALNAAALRAAGHSEMPEAEGASAVVPGAVAGIAKLAAEHGRKGLDAVLAPAIRYFRGGGPGGPPRGLRLGRLGRSAPGSWPPAHFLSDGRALGEGAVFRAPGQAEVLRRIAAGGAAAFYEGEVAEDMIAALRAHGGVHEAADFAACQALEVTPITAPYRDAEVVELPPNTHGATALLMLRMLERFAPEVEPWGAERAHLEMEIAKLGYAARNQAIADPDAMTMTVEDFTSEATAEALAARIDRARAGPLPSDPLGTPHKDTIYITVVDRDRMAVSLIYSIFASFGSGIASERFGILFNNRAAGFTLKEGHPNEAAGGKRPMHTIIPGMIREGGRVTVPFGVMGGPYQAAGHMRFVSNLVDYGAGPAGGDRRAACLLRGCGAQARDGLWREGRRSAGGQGARHPPAR